MVKQSQDITITTIKITGNTNLPAQKNAKGRTDVIVTSFDGSVALIIEMKCLSRGYKEARSDAMAQALRYSELILGEKAHDGVREFVFVVIFIEKLKDGAKLTHLAWQYSELEKARDLRKLWNGWIALRNS